MKFRIIKEHGDVVITDNEIINAVHEQLLMIPGIRVVGCGNLKDKFFAPKAIEVYQVRTNSIGISIHIRLDQFVNVIETSKGVQENIKFMIERKYGIIVDHIDVNIEGIENAK